MNANIQKTGRAGGRSARRLTREATDFSMLPGLTSALPLCEVMDGAQVERIDDASMSILENVGIVFRDPIALEDWRKAGADGLRLPWQQFLTVQN